MQGSVRVLLLVVFVFALLGIKLMLDDTASQHTRSNVPGMVNGVVSKPTSVNEALNMGDFQSGMEMIDAVLAQDPRNADALLTKAQILAEQGSAQFQEDSLGMQSIQIARRVLAIDPRSEDAWRIIGYAYEIMQDYHAAHAAYAESLAINPMNAFTISQQAHAYDLQGKLDKAEAGYRAALAIKPDLIQAQMGLGRILVSRNELVEAFNIFSRISYTSSSNVRMRSGAAYSAGSIASALGDVDSADEFMQLSTSLNPEYSLGWAGMGKVSFERALATSTDLSVTQRNELISASIASLQKAIDLNPFQSAAYLQLALELSSLGDTESAKKIYSELRDDIIAHDITLNAVDKSELTARVQSALDSLK